MIKRLTYTILLLFITSGHLLAEGYTKEDLLVLAKENNFNEFIQHAQDIRPSQRDEWWKEQMKKMGKKFIEDKILQQDFDPQTEKSIESLFTLAAVREDEFTSTRREEYHRALLKNCFKVHDKMECYQKLSSFWETTKGSINRPEMALEFSALLEQNNIKVDMWKFYLPITTGSTATFYCGHDKIREVLVKQLVSHFSRTADATKFIQTIKDFANADCIEKLIPYFRQQLSSENITEAEMSYRILLEKKQIDSIDSAAFLISFLMMGPVVGETFNQSWNTLEQLGKDYSLRMKVLEKLNRFELIPDELINSANTKKRDLLLDLMNRNFPEFLDLYARKCLDYLEGKKTFPNGNPTKYCKQFFKMAKDKQWPHSGLKLRFDALPRL